MKIISTIALSILAFTALLFLPGGIQSGGSASGASSLPIQVNGSSIATATTLNIAAGTNVTASGANAGGVVTVTVNASGAGGASAHHQYFPGAVGTAGADSRSSINGLNSAHLGAIPIGLGGSIPNSGGNFSVVVRLPSTWTGSITAVVDATTSTNGTGNFALTPQFSCAASGFDLGAAPSYTSGTPVTVAAPGGAGTGFYLVPMTLAFSGSGCSAGSDILLNFVRGNSDTYASDIYVLGVDVSVIY